MRKILNAVGLAAVLSAAGICVTFVSPAAAANDVFPLSIDQAMAAHIDNEKLDGSVKFYFGDAPHPAVLQSFGSFATNKKTNAFGKSDFATCSWALQSVLQVLQRRAESLGANAVINIHSYYTKDDVTTATQIPCHRGFLMSGIAVRGDFVKVAGP